MKNVTKKFIYSTMISLCLISTSQAVPLSTFLNAFAVDEKASYSANNWSNVKIKPYKWKNNDYNGQNGIYTEAKIDKFGLASISFKGSKTKVFRMEVSRSPEYEEGVDLSLDELASNNMKVKLIRKCKEEMATEHQRIYEIKLPKKKIIYAFESFSTGMRVETAFTDWTFVLDKNYFDADEKIYCYDYDSGAEYKLEN